MEPPVTHLVLLVAMKNITPASDVRLLPSDAAVSSHAMPSGVVFPWINVSRRVRPGVHRQLSVAIAVEIKASQADLTGYRALKMPIETALPFHDPFAAVPHCRG
jgi:hypothetical protein